VFRSSALWARLRAEIVADARVNALHTNIVLHTIVVHDGCLELLMQAATRTVAITT
jgi:hypothetical protein